MNWLDLLLGWVGEAAVFALASFGILSFAVIYDFLRQKKCENKFSRRFLSAKTRGKKQNSQLGSYDFDPDARYECSIKFLIPGKQTLETLLNNKDQKKEVGSKRVFISSSSNNMQTTNLQVSMSIVLADRFGYIAESEYHSFLDYAEEVRARLGNNVVL